MTLSAAAELNRTRVEIALRTMTEATEHIKRLEEQLERAFQEYLAAQERCKEEGLQVDYQMTPSMAAGFADYKQRQFRDALREEKLA